MKRLKLFVLALVLSLSAFSVLAPRTFAATRTWTGGGSGNNMSTAANWGGTAPVAGDDLVFPAGTSKNTVVNDLTAATSFNSITFSGATTNSNDQYTLSGNSMTLAGNVTVSMTGSYAYETISAPLIISGNRTVSLANSSASLELSGAISGSGDITKTGAGTVLLKGNNSTYTGNLIISAGTLVAMTANAFGTTAGSTTVASGASLNVSSISSDTTFAEPLNLSGTGTGFYSHALDVTASYGNNSVVTAPYPTLTFSGALTLGSNITVGAFDRNATFTGVCTGSYTISSAQGASGVVQVSSSSNGCGTPNGSLEGASYTTNYDTNQAGAPISVNNKETAVVKGTVGDVTIANGGTLKGTGTVGVITAQSGATVAPGLSPGCLNASGLSLASGSTYQAEIGGDTACTGYDQLKVTGTVTVTGATLATSLYNSFKPAVGATYKIIDNDGTADAVTGTFKDLAEGATFTVSGYVFKISYVGGDGNDVVLTVQSVPVTPDTGFAMIKSNPLVSMAVVLGAGAAIAIAARRTSRTTARSRR